MKEKQNEAGRKRIKSSVLSSWAPLGIVCSLLFHFLKLSAKTFINYWVLGGKKKRRIYLLSPVFTLVNIGHIGINTPHSTWPMYGILCKFPFHRCSRENSEQGVGKWKAWKAPLGCTQEKAVASHVADRATHIWLYIWLDNQVARGSEDSWNQENRSESWEAPDIVMDRSGRSHRYMHYNTWVYPASGGLEGSYNSQSKWDSCPGHMLRHTVLSDICALGQLSQLEHWVEYLITLGVARTP